MDSGAGEDPVRGDLRLLDQVWFCARQVIDPDDEGVVGPDRAGGYCSERDDQRRDRSFRPHVPSTHLGGKRARTLALRVEWPHLTTDDVTALLLAWGDGDQAALDRLMPIVYGELHRLAQRYMRREGNAGTLQATALVNEAYMRMVDVRRMRWQNRAHFFAVAATLMRRILVDAARSRLAKKRGDRGELVPIDESIALADAPIADVLAIDDALGRLSAVDPRKARVVELRFFGGLTVAETAEALHVSAETVMRDWKMAKSWLKRELHG